MPRELRGIGFFDDLEILDDEESVRMLDERTDREQEEREEEFFADFGYENLVDVLEDSNLDLDDLMQLLDRTDDLQKEEVQREIDDEQDRGRIIVNKLMKGTPLNLKRLKQLLENMRGNLTDDVITALKTKINNHSISIDRFKNRRDRLNEFHKSHWIENTSTILEGIDENGTIVLSANGGFKEFLTRKNLSSITGLKGEKLFIQFLSVYISNLPYTDERITTIHALDVVRRKKVKQKKVDDSRLVKGLRKINRREIKLVESGKSRIKKIVDILKPDSTNAYEDVRWYNGGRTLTELLIDVKVSEDGKLSGNLLSIQKAEKNAHRPLWYVKIDWSKGNPIVINSVSSIFNRQMKFENFNFYGDRQYKFSDKTLRALPINIEHYKLALYISNVINIERIIYDFGVLYHEYVEKLIDITKPTPPSTP